MGNETITFAYSNRLEKLITELGLGSLFFVKQALKLGLLVEKGVVHQMIEGTPCRLRMTDFNPYPVRAELPQLPPGTQVLSFEVPPEVEAEIKKTSPLAISKWVCRAVSLRLMAENIDFRALIDGEYVRISFENEEESTQAIP